MESNKILKSVLFASAASLALCATAAPAAADNIVAGTYYTGGFTTAGTPLFGPGYTTYTTSLGPSAAAPGAPWVITLATDNHSLTITDMETSGDQFTLYDNGHLLGTTSAPCDFCEYGMTSVAGALADSNYSHGVFGLFAGTNVITGTFDGVVGTGDFVFEVSTPEPVTLSLFGAGLVGAAAIGMRRKKKSA